MTLGALRVLNKLWPSVLLEMRLAGCPIIIILDDIYIISYIWSSYILLQLRYMKNVSSYRNHKVKI